MNLDLAKCLEAMVEKNASDLHIKAGAPPIVRKNKQLAILFKDHPSINHKEILSTIQKMLNSSQLEDLMMNKQLDFGYGVPGLGRFRFNVFFQRGSLRMVARNIPYKIPSFADLNLPELFKTSMEKHQDGLILVTGATGNGKSSSVVAMLNHINQTKSRHIVTIEDPIEFLIQDKKSIISQRELGTDYISYEMALKASLRQDPDIIFLGELRDQKSVETALTAANTGHLVITTLHTNNVAETINRVLSMLGQERSNFARMNFASCLRSILCQKLVPKKEGNGLIPAIEILINNPRVRGILEDSNKSTSILTKIVEESREGWGMQSLNQHLLDLVLENKITKEKALEASYSPEKLTLQFDGLNHDKNSSGKDFGSVIDTGALSILKAPIPPLIKKA